MTVVALADDASRQRLVCLIGGGGAAVLPTRYVMKEDVQCAQ